MKIAIVYDAVYPFAKGGVEKRAYLVAKALSKKHEIHLFGMQYWPGEKNIKHNGVFLHGVCKAGQLYNSSGRRSLLQPVFFSLALLPELMKSDFDLVDCQNFPYFPAIAAKIACVLKRKPLIITWHEVWYNYWFEYLGALGFAGKAIELLAARLAKHNTAVSRQTMKGLALLGIKEENLALIENGIDLEKIKQAGKGRKEFDLLYAGRLSKEKNLQLLIKAVALLKQGGKKNKCLIIGEGKEKERLQLLAKGLGLEKEIRFSGFVSQQRLYSLMKSSSLFVLPSTREGFGLAALEAMSCGCPLLTANSSNNAAKQFVSNGKNGFVFELNAEDLAKKIRACENKRLLKTMGKKSIKFAGKFSLQRMSRKSERHYRQCMGTKENGSAKSV